MIINHIKQIQFKSKTIITNNRQSNLALQLSVKLVNLQSTIWQKKAVLLVP